jgi:hypothetical protein
MRRLCRLSVFDLSFLNPSLSHLFLSNLFLLSLFLACLVASIFSGASVAAKQPKLQMSEIMIPSGDDGIQLYVRNKHPAGRETSPDKILLFVHGATYPAETAFDLPIEGVSMMDLIAARGYDVYLVDVRGYGRSTRPAEMSQPPEANKPIVSTKVAARDLGAAVPAGRVERGNPHGHAGKEPSAILSRADGLP